MREIGSVCAGETYGGRVWEREVGFVCEREIGWVCEREVVEPV